MKKIRNLSLLASAVVLMTMAYSSAQAQYARAGIKGGLNLSNLYVERPHDDEARVGWHAGVYGQLFASEAFAIQPEVNYSTKGTGVTRVDANSVQFDSKFNLQYIDIPILAVFKLGDFAEIHAGAYWAYLLGAEISNNDRIPNNEFRTVDRDNFEDWDYGLVGGIGFNLGDAAQLGVRYNYGLNKIADSPGARLLFGDSKNQVAQLYLAFNFGGKSNRTSDGYDY
jgi:hypothetical protein